MTYIITDPCYILTSEEWERCYSSNESIKQELEKITDKAIVHSTDGDGRYFFKSGKKLGRFCIDSGVVCIVRENDEIYKRLSKLRESLYDIVYGEPERILLHNDNLEVLDSNGDIIAIAEF